MRHQRWIAVVLITPFLVAACSQGDTDLVGLVNPKLKSVYEGPVVEVTIGGASYGPNGEEFQPWSGGSMGTYCGFAEEWGINPSGSSFFPDTVHVWFDCTDRSYTIGSTPAQVPYNGATIQIVAITGDDRAPFPNVDADFTRTVRPTDFPANGDLELSFVLNWVGDEPCRFLYWTLYGGYRRYETVLRVPAAGLTSVHGEFQCSSGGSGAGTQEG